MVIDKIERQFVILNAVKNLQLHLRLIAPLVKNHVDWYKPTSESYINNQVVCGMIGAYEVKRNEDTGDSSVATLLQNDIGYHLYLS